LKKLFCGAAVLAAACGPPGALPLLPTLSFVVPVPPPPAAIVPLDGRWVIADASGERSCLVIQESRVSILDLTCSPDGRGFVSRITDGPIISRAGGTITLSVTYNPRSFDSAIERLSFTGTLQVDGTFIGTRTFSRPESGDAPVSRVAILSRS
jgi:hypothetical protein